MKTRIDKKAALRELQTIPSVGKSIADDLWKLGIRSVAQLKHRNPETLYRDHCIQKGMPVDRCVLYTFRCAVYYASTTRPKPELLKWWNWKNRKL
jgi:Pathogenicity locus